MTSHETLLKDALKLRPVDRAHLIEELMFSLEKPDPEIDLIWELEALKRYEAYKQNRTSTKDLEEVLNKFPYKKIN